MLTRILTLLLAVLVLPAPARADAPAEFQQGLQWLHSFEYERALSAFRRAELQAPTYVMAYWGQAMCYQQLLWGNEDVAAARAIRQRLQAVPFALARAAPKERAWVATLDVLFGSGPRIDRLRKYASEMARMAAAYPDDAEVAAFHGLAVLATAPRGPEPSHTAADHEGGFLPDSAVQAEAARIFSEVLEAQPRHPGALHYLIHTWDDPNHAALALPAARLYPQVAPESSHALHMPAHIFVQLGLWQDAASSDEASYRASASWVERERLPIAVRDYHSLSWLTYEYLQQGRYRAAEETLPPIREAIAASDQARLKALLATMQARIAVEGARWDHAPGPDYRNVDELFAVGIGAAQRGDLGTATRARQRMLQMAGEDRYRSRRDALLVMERSLAALIHLHDGRGDEAVALMEEAMAFDKRLPPPAGPPQPIKPAPEIFGEVLLAVGRPKEAAAQFDAALTRWQNRSASVLGLARALAADGDVVRARERARQFLDNWERADADRPELTDARALATLEPSAAWRRRWIVGGVTVALLLAGAGVVRARRGRGETRVKPSGARSAGKRRG